MAQNPPDGYQRIIPYFVTPDPGAVMDFAARALGFAERERIPGPGGAVMHGEMAYQGNVMMLGLHRGDEPASTSMLYCYVDDVDAHHARAVEAGAEVVSELTDQPYGDRSYGVRDPDGNQWWFATRVRDVPAEEVAAALAGGDE